MQHPQYIPPARLVFWRKYGARPLLYAFFKVPRILEGKAGAEPDQQQQARKPQNDPLFRRVAVFKRTQIFETSWIYVIETDSLPLPTMISLARSLYGHSPLATFYCSMDDAFTGGAKQHQHTRTQQPPLDELSVAACVQSGEDMMSSQFTLSASML
jgi:hypothetical protein